MKNLYLLIFILSCASTELSSSFDNDIRIKSDTIEFLEKNNQINFLDNVEINSDFVNIKAESAVYDDIKDMISILGKPSTIKSRKKNTSFIDHISKHSNVLGIKFIYQHESCRRSSQTSLCQFQQL